MNESIHADKAESESLADLAVSTSSVASPASTSDAVSGNGAASTVGERLLHALFAKQAIELDATQQQLARCRTDMAEIHGVLVCIGGPLNDNVLGYSADQRKPLHRIANIAEGWIA